ncbi:MAG: DNA cytosine methyltransferase [Cytophagaceae bacterium]|nr:DNA cytosine methyltransferase [Cytophagaceae bacterium]MDW8457399.1 DNA cytosine methyltransferase [Cytophagaceae bacterium]
MKQLNYIDIFAGTSALSEGFRQLKFNPVAYIEMDAEACLTIKTREAYHHLKEAGKLDTYYDYISGNITRDSLYKHIPSEIETSVINSEISDSSLKNIFKIIEINLKKLPNNELDLIIGGPPCQAYSIIGRHCIDWENDHRTKLYVQYGRFLKEFRPKVFVFENVPGIYTANNGSYFTHLKKYFRKIGYETDDRILNAKDFGVLQNRKRVFIVGWRKDIQFSFPELTPIVHNYTVEDILSDLSPLTPGQVINKGRYRKLPSEYLRQFDLSNGADFYTQHISRPHNSNDLKIYRLAIEKWNKERKRLRYSDIPERLQTHKNTRSFLDRFKVVDGKGVSHTVVAHIAKDGHYYIHPDIHQCRSISVREAARIQSFPDDFFFEGSRTSIFRQIGNAVPPLLSLALAKGIKKQFEML